MSDEQKQQDRSTSGEQETVRTLFNPEDYNEKGEKIWKRKKPADRTNAGTRPHRCAIRYTDFLASFSTMSLGKISGRWSLFYQCMRSKPGQEPRDPVEFLDEDTYEFYQEMQVKKRIRDKFVDESSPYSSFDHSVYLPPRRQDLEKKAAEERQAREQ